MKLLEFFKGRNGNLSSKRLFMFGIVVSTIVDWQHAVWTVGTWHPETAVLIFIGTFFGVNVAGALTEPKVNGNAAAKTNQ